MPLHRSSFLTTDCNEDQGTYSLALFTNLKQKLQFCKHSVNGVRKNPWDIALFAHWNTPTSSEYAESVRSKSLLVVETIAKKYSKTQNATLKFLAQGELKFPILMD